MVPARKVGSSDAVEKQDVASNQDLILGMIKGNVPGSMPGYKKNV
jgi:hypothetical protein